MVLIATLLLSGCHISTYSPAPNKAEPNSLPKANTVIHFSFYPPEVAAEKGNKSQMAALPIEASLLQQYLEKYSVFTTAILSPTAPVSGPHVVLTKVQIMNSDFNNAWCRVSLLTLFILPCYLNETASTLRYDVYEGDQVLKSYVYEIGYRGITWWGVLPFFWLHGMMTEYAQSCEAVTARFLIEAHADGYL